MDQLECITKSPHRKGAHLTFEERVIIQTRLRDGWSPPQIAKEIGCAPNTVRNEIRRGKVLLYNGKHEGYRAVNGQDIYKANRENCGRTSLHQKRKAFLTYVVNMFRQKKWSLDVCVGRALLTGAFRRDEIVCTKTLYNYVTKDLLKPIKSIDLPERTRRKQRHRRVAIEARTDGHSIDDRDPCVMTRTTFRHWETDLMLGGSRGKEALLAIAERKSRFPCLRKVKDKKSSSIMEALYSIQEEFGGSFEELFETITTDNGTEFSRLPELEEGCNLRIYYAHPYCPSDKGMIENMNRIIRRFIPKGKRLEDCSENEIIAIQQWLRDLPRKKLGYHTAQECFLNECRKASIC